MELGRSKKENKHLFEKKKENVREKTEKYRKSESEIVIEETYRIYYVANRHKIFVQS